MLEERADDWFLKVYKHVKSAVEHRLEGELDPECAPGMTKYANRQSALAGALMLAGMVEKAPRHDQAASD